jgi:hypothetical protein
MHGHMTIPLVAKPVDCSSVCMTAGQVRATGDDTLLAMLEGRSDMPDGEFVYRQPNCPEHGEPGTVSAAIVSLAAAHRDWVAADFDHEANPGSYGAMCSADLTSERRDEAVSELVLALLRERLGLRGEPTVDQVRDALIAKARDTDRWRAQAVSYAAGVDAALTALTRVL